MRYFLELCYKGTAYNGWQIQTKQAHVKTVQAVLENRLSLMLNEKIRLIVSARTDTGVHARQQFAHFETIQDINTANIHYKLNKFVPADIAIRKIRPTNPKAHARFDALQRVYEYQVITLKDPFSNQMAWFYTKAFNFKVLEKTAKILEQSTYFKNFSKVKTDSHNFCCYIYEATWVKKSDHLFCFYIRGNRFLRSMVRLLVGQMLQVASGKMSIELFEKQLTYQKDGKPQTYTCLSAPAQGLTLMQISFPKHIFLF